MIIKSIFHHSYFCEVIFDDLPCRSLTKSLSNLRRYLLDNNLAIDAVICPDAIAIYHPKISMHALREVVSQNFEEETTSSTTITIDYDGKDLDAVCQLLNMDVKTFIYLHTEQEYYVSMMGFLMGFPYISDLPKELILPRKSQPTNVRKGDVAIANTYTGIYPQSSPGGWYVIGHTDFITYQSMPSPKFFLSPGSIIKFQAK